jgi:pimeloyl-ACP methyl ester carboxylesterase
MTGILLIHGAWHGPWCWDGFAARLAEAGHDVRTVRLRGHDQSGERIWHRIHHYLEDVHRAAERFAEPPVLVGHSMGGLLAQRYAQRHPAGAVVLLASLPSGSAIRVAARLAVRHPLAMIHATLRLRLKPLVTTRAQTRAMFFTDDTQQAIVDSCHARLQDESYLALLDMLVPPMRRPKVRAPVLVLGASNDAIISAGVVRRTARAYGTEAELFDGMGHHMTLDVGWERVADRVHAWVRRVGSPTKGAA